MPDCSLYGVVLAAGLSTRAGRFKMELPLGDRTLIEHTALGMVDVVDRIIVVGGHRAERLSEILQGCEKVEVVTNERYPLGMFTSVQTGLRRVREIARASAPSLTTKGAVGSGFAVFLQPGDIPLVDKKTYRTLLETPGGVVIPTCDGRKGHPVLIAAQWIEAILAEPDTSNLRDFIQRAGYVTVEVEDEGIVLDVDDPDDYRRVLERWANGTPGKETIA